MKTPIINNEGGALTPYQLAERVRDTAEGEVQGWNQIIWVLILGFFFFGSIWTGIIYVPIISEIAGFGRDGKKIVSVEKKQVENPAYVSPSNPYGESSNPQTNLDKNLQPETQKESYPNWIFFLMMGIVFFIIAIQSRIKRAATIHRILSANQHDNH